MDHDERIIALFWKRRAEREKKGVGKRRKGSWYAVEKKKSLSRIVECNYGQLEPERGCLDSEISTFFFRLRPATWVLMVPRTRVFEILVIIKKIR